MTADIALLREAGGLGDIIRFGSVGRYLHRQDPGVKVTAYTLPQFVSAVERLDGVDSVVPLPLFQLKTRRPRGSPWQQAPYLRAVVRRTHTRVVDLFCPGYLYEVRCQPPVQYSRAEIFCGAAGLKLPTTEDLRPVWVVRPEDTAKAQALNLPPNAVGLALRATDSARTVDPESVLELAVLLRARGMSPVIIDSTQHHPPGVAAELIGQPIEVVAAALQRFSCVVAVCSGILHLAGALGVKCVGLFGPTDPAVMLKHYPTHQALTATGYTTSKATEFPCMQPCWFRPAFGWKADVCRPSGCYWINKIDLRDVVKAVIACRNPRS